MEGFGSEPKLLIGLIGFICNCVYYINFLFPVLLAAWLQAMSAALIRVYWQVWHRHLASAQAAVCHQSNCLLVLVQSQEGLHQWRTVLVVLAIPPQQQPPPYIITVQFTPTHRSGQPPTQSFTLLKQITGLPRGQTINQYPSEFPTIPSSDSPFFTQKQLSKC